MRTIKTIALTTDRATIPVHPGERVRVISIQADVGTNEADIAKVLFLRGSVQLMVSVSNRMPTSVSIVCGAIGANASVNNEVNVDPVTGDVSYEQNADHWSLPIPDVWWDIEIIVIIVMVLGGATAGIVVYELDDGK